MPYLLLFDTELLSVLEASDRKEIDGLIKLSRRLQPPQGVCVVIVNHEGKMVYEWSDSNCISTVGENRMERPLLFASLANAEKRLNNVLDQENTKYIGSEHFIEFLAWWHHEWETCLPIDKYHRMSQTRFPGSPSQ